MASNRIIEWNDTGGMSGWGVDDFIAWHRGLVKHYGSKKHPKKDGTLSSVTSADYIFILGWIKNTMPNSFGMMAIAAAPSQFKEEISYFEKYPFLYEFLQFKNIVKVGKYNPINISAKVVETTVGVVDDVIDTVAGVVKILKVTVFVALIGGAIVGGMYLYKKSQTA